MPSVHDNGDGNTLAAHELVDAVLTLVLLAVLTWEAVTYPRTAAVVPLIHWLLFGSFAALALYRWLGPPRQRHPGSVLFESAMLVVAFPPLVAAAGPIRALRILRLPLAGARSVRALRRVLVRRGVVVLVAATSLSAFVGALAILEFERRHQITTVPDALWWATATMTTVGYGDLAPRTTGGRVVALALMVVGIAAFGMTTALLARWFLELSGADDDEESELRSLRLEVAALRAELQPGGPPGRSE